MFETVWHECNFYTFGNCFHSLWALTKGKSYPLKITCMVILVICELDPAEPEQQFVLTKYGTSMEPHPKLWQCIMFQSFAFLLDRIQAHHTCGTRSTRSIDMPKSSVISTHITESLPAPQNMASPTDQQAVSGISSWGSSLISRWHLPVESWWKSNTRYTYQNCWLCRQNRVTNGPH